jgi:hypothetical protein
MAKIPKRPRDPNQLAKSIVDIATGVAEKNNPEVNAKKRKSGLKGAEARNKALTPEQKAEIAHVAAQARWKKSD